MKVNRLTQYIVSYEKVVGSGLYDTPQQDLTEVGPQRL